MEEKWLNDTVEKYGEKEKRLLKRAVTCLKANMSSSEKGTFLDGRTIIIPSKNAYMGVWNWDSAFIALSVSRWDLDLALSQIEIFFENQDKTGMFPDALFLNGMAITRTSKPPVFAWVLMEIAKRNKDLDVQYYYGKLVKNEKFWCNHRKAGDLFHYDAFTREEGYEGYERDCRNESGWDNSVRWDNGAENLWAIDLNCYMVLFYRAMAYFAKRLNRKKEVALWKKKERFLSERIEEVFWNEEKGFYCDYDFDLEQSTEVLSPAGFMPLFIKIANKERAEKCCQKAMDENCFYPMIPTVSYNNTEYSPTNFWRGPTWINTWYFAVVGLYNYGYTTLAKDLKKYMLEVCDKEKRDIFEYYHSKTGEGIGAAQFSWSAVFIIETILNNI